MQQFDPSDLGGLDEHLRDCVLDELRTMQRPQSPFRLFGIIFGAAGGFMALFGDPSPLQVTLLIAAYVLLLLTPARFDRILFVRRVTAADAAAEFAEHIRQIHGQFCDESQTEEDDDAYRD